LADLPWFNLIVNSIMAPCVTHGIMNRLRDRT
jgi:hypothetical protein